MSLRHTSASPAVKLSRRRCEWSGGVGGVDSPHCCPYCFRTITEGHKHDCVVGVALDRRDFSQIWGKWALDPPVWMEMAEVAFRDMAYYLNGHQRLPDEVVDEIVHNFVQYFMGGSSDGGGQRNLE